MTYALEFIRIRPDATRMPGFRAAVVLSILLHALVLWRMPMRLQSPTPDLIGEPQVPLSVQLVPHAMPGPPPTAVPSAPPRAHTPPTPARPLQTAPMLTLPPVALNKPAPTAPPLPREPTVSESAPAPTPAAPDTDLAAYIEARRRANGAPAPAPAAPAEDENARASKLALANLRLQQPAMGYDPSKSGGVFEVKNRNIDYGEFIFFGWNREVRRDISQLVEVRRGNNATIELAMVRKMIEIIRQY